MAKDLRRGLRLLLRCAAAAAAAGRRLLLQRNLTAGSGLVIGRGLVGRCRRCLLLRRFLHGPLLCGRLVAVVVRIVEAFDVGLTYMVMVYIVVAYIVMAYIVVAYIIMDNI